MRRCTGSPRRSSEYKTRVIDIDLKAYFDNVRHDLLLGEGGAPGSMTPT